jgi:hypothetical protein
LCRINTKLHELYLEEEAIHHIQSLLIEAFDIESNLSDPSKELFQIDELPTSSSNSNTSNHTTLKQINVLTYDQKFILEAIKKT